MYKYAFTPKVCVRVVVLLQGRGGEGRGGEGEERGFTMGYKCQGGGNEGHKKLMSHWAK